jgi:hypothetical protein
MLSNRMMTILFLLIVIFIALGISIFFGKKVFLEGLTLTDDQTKLLELTRQYQINDLSLCASAIYQIQPLVTDNTDANQNFISQTITNYFTSPPTALYNIINHPKSMTPIPPEKYTIPDKVEAIITTTQSSRNSLCSNFINNIFATVPDLTTKQGNQAPSDQILSQQLNAFKKQIQNGNAPLPGNPQGGKMSAPTDITLYLSSHFYLT